VAAGFEGFEITWRKDVFSGAPQAGSAASFGTLGINFRARKAADREAPDAASSRETPAQEASVWRTTQEGGSPQGDAINMQALRGMLERGERVTVVDVRKGEDRAEWSIPGSVHVDAYDALNAGDERAMDGLELPEGAPVVTVCGRGRSSAVAAEQLRERGYEALTLEGGMKSWSLAWNSAEVPVEGSDAEVVQIRRTGKGCLSYLVGSRGEAAVIDAAVDPEVYAGYAGLAEERGWRITHVLDTHVHADHLSRSRTLAELTGAELHMPAGASVSYPVSPLGEGEEVRIGEARLRALRTPGHTSESTSYHLDGKALFTGDTLFLSTVGRPDLEATPEGAREKAHALFGSVRRLRDLPSQTLVLPGHTSEPVPFDGEPIFAPLLEVREEVGLLLEDEEHFVDKVASRLTPTPENYERIVEHNRSGDWPQGDPTELEAGANHCAAG
jgi:glyoxylase-like metal-dependent hydrolase (beta-lactamase superfamily II)/rhodanese-related sulfurtransferase